MAKSRAAIVADYQQKFEAMEATRGPAVESAAKRILANMPAYRAVEAKTGVPAAFVGVLHMRECNNDMRGCLHNGERIIGTSRKTRLVPAGRGPFATWEIAAIDALGIEGFLGMADTSPGALCEAAERYNGLGYRNKGRPSPYVWAGSQFYTAGKYIRDGVYSSTFVDPQLGIAPVMKRVMELDNAAKPSLVGRVVQRSAEKKATQRAEYPAAHKNDTATGFLEYLGLGSVSLLGILQQIGAFVVDWRTLSIFGVGAAVWGGFKLRKYLAMRGEPIVIPAADVPTETANA